MQAVAVSLPERHASARVRQAASALCAPAGHWPGSWRRGAPHAPGWTCGEAAGPEVEERRLALHTAQLRKLQRGAGTSLVCAARCQRRLARCCLGAAQQRRRLPAGEREGAGRAAPWLGACAQLQALLPDRCCPTAAAQRAHAGARGPVVALRTHAPSSAHFKPPSQPVDGDRLEHRLQHPHQLRISVRSQRDCRQGIQASPC